MPATPEALLEFLNRAKTPYHAAETVAGRLREAGYVELAEREPWSLEPGMRAYVLRAGASVVAFEVGTKPPSEAGFLVIGAHTDSPNLRLKPNFELRGNRLFGVSVEPYGGLLLHSWLDRPLGLAGRVVTTTGETVLVSIDRALLTLPSLAIHLQRDVNQQGLVLNPQQHLRPLLGLDADGAAPHPLRELVTSTLNEAIGQQLGSSATISAFDLRLFDVTTAAFVGQNDAFVASGRLDNLVSAHVGLEALLDVHPAIESTRVFVVYDHEEVGSRSYGGAQSTLLGDVLGRVAQRLAPSDPEAIFRAMAASLLLSADMAHALHPNYADKHDDLNRPLLGSGPVLKTNAGQSYATDAVSAAAIAAAAKRAELELQRFVTRSDLPCGSTIGPLAAARQGIRTVDVGNPMLGMHSCRELCAASDVPLYGRLMTEWYRTTIEHRSRS
ncbi:MAG: M18 family aminopeptidase [Polyangiaceae bacterium]